MHCRHREHMGGERIKKKQQSHICFDQHSFFSYSAGSDFWPRSKDGAVVTMEEDKDVEAIKEDLKSQQATAKSEAPFGSGRT